MLDPTITSRMLVIVAGCQRSGTTLVGQMLGAHARAVLIDEPDDLYPWFQAFLEGAEDAPSLLSRVLAKAAQKYQRPANRFVTGAEGAVGLAPHVSHIVLKAPNLTFLPEEIGRLGRRGQQVRVIYPVRDARAVVASMQRLPQIDFAANQARHLLSRPEITADFEAETALITDTSAPGWRRAAAVWRIKSALADRFRSAGTQTFQFRYEHLLRDPARLARLLADAAGLPDAAGLDAHETVLTGVGPGGTERTRPIDALAPGAWADVLSAEQAQDVMAIAGDLMAELGYDPAPPEPIRARIEAVLDRPVILTGRGGGGTRLLSQIVRNAGVFLGNAINESGDSLEWVDSLYGLVPLSGDRTALEAAASALRKQATRILQAGGRTPGQPWGLKLPEAVLTLPALFKAFPDARLVHLVRHPVDVALRRSHVTSRISNPVGRAVLSAAYAAMGRDPTLMATDPEHLLNAISWLYQTEAGEAFARALPRDRALTVRYEDYCDQPDYVQASILGFLGRCSDAPPPAVDMHRRRAWSPGDPRVEEVWALCGALGARLGYSAPDDTSSQACEADRGAHPGLNRV